MVTTPDLPYRDRILDAVARHRPYLVRARRHLHQHPERSFEERATAGYLAAELRDAGLVVLEGLGGGYSVVTTVGAGPGPMLAFVAHIDAVAVDEPDILPFHSRNPGLMHACGHDLNAAILLATARALAEPGFDVSGRVRFIFEPGEEMPPGGALGLVEAGVLDDVDAVFGLHQSPTPSGRLHLTDGPIIPGGDSFVLTIRGQSGQGDVAGMGADAIHVASQIVSGLHQIVSRRIGPRTTAEVTIASIHGGDPSTIVAGEVIVTGYLRAFDEEVRSALRGEIERVVGGLSAAWSATVSLAFTAGYPALVNDPAMTAIARSAAALVLDPEEVRTGGWPLGLPMDDFARYLERVPGCYAGLGVAQTDDPARTRVHSPDYVLDESAMDAGFAWFLALATSFSALSNGPLTSGQVSPFARLD